MGTVVPAPSGLDPETAAVLAVAVRPELAGLKNIDVLDGPVRRCLHCDAFTTTFYKAHALRCPICKNATAGLDVETIATVLDLVLPILSPDQVRAVLRGSLLRLWERKLNRATIASAKDAASPLGRHVGPPAIAPLDRRPWQERFFDHVDRNGDGECWLWTGGTGAGRPRFQFRQHERGGYSAPAWRVAWELTRGEDPPDQLKRTCDQTMCVNPAHHERVGGDNPPCPDCGERSAKRGRGVRKDGTVRIRYRCRNGHRFAEVQASD